MISLRLLSYLFCILIVSTLSSCLPIPTTRQPLNVPTVEFDINPESVLRETVFVEGFQEPHTPSDYNGSLVTKYARAAAKLAKVDPAKFDPAKTLAKTIVVMMPGIYGGSNTLEPIARQLVAANNSLEVWIVDRRANLLEDIEGIRESIAAKDGTLAYDYYVKNYGQVNGYQPPKSDDVAFMQYWGLEVHLADLHAVILQAAQESEELYLLGHSLGASMVSFYTAFEVDDNHIGEDFLDGLILLDGVLGRTGGFNGIQWFGGFGGGLEIASSQNGDEGVTLQGLTGFDTYIPNLTQEFVARASAALLARFDPEGISPLYDFPVTNRAAFGVGFDDSFETSTVFGVSVGEIKDASVAGNIIPFLLDGDIGAFSKSLVGVQEGAETVSWDKTLNAIEVCDIDAFAKNHSGPEVNFNEWYFPVEFMLDIAGYDMTLENTANFIATSEVSVPTLAMGAERGLIQSLDTFSAYTNLRAGSLVSTVIIDNFTHGDILCAEVNPATTIVLSWLEQLRNIRQ